MRIVVVSAWEPWRVSDGAAFVLHHQLQAWRERHEITVLAAGAPAATAAPPADVAAALPGVDLRWFGTNRGLIGDQAARRAWSLRHREPAHVAFVERPALVAALEAEVQRGVDVVHLHGWGTAALWSRVSGTPTVHMAIDPWSVNATNRRRSSLRTLVEREQTATFAAHERRHYPRLGAVVVVAPHDAETIRELAPGARVEVVPNGVDAGPEPTRGSGAPVIGFHGVFDSQANVDAANVLVTEVLPLVRRRVPAASVVLVGRRPPREVLALAGPGVEVVGDAVDLRVELERMAVHVDWMTSGTGLKNKVLEAMAAARPVVSSRLGAEGIDEGPGLVVADDLDEASTAIVDLLLDPAVAAETGAAGRARVLRDFTWDASARRIEALWSEVTG